LDAVKKTEIPALVYKKNENGAAHGGFLHGIADALVGFANDKPMNLDGKMNRNGSAADMDELTTPKYFVK
jgi:hypothetical protein